LSIFALYLNKKRTYKILLEAVNTLVHTNESDKMNSAFLILAHMAEGCVEQIQKNLANPIMSEYIPLGLNHQSPEVRGAAIKCLCFLTEYLSEEMVEYHKQIIPAMLNYFNDLSLKVAEKAVFAIDRFCEAMDAEDIIPYL
jgi:hypothetical protein